MEDYLWAKYRVATFTPRIPGAILESENVYFQLGRRYSRFYIAQILSAAAKLVCTRPACQMANDSKALKDLFWDRSGDPDLRKEVLTKTKPCGPYIAWFVPLGKTFRDMYSLGHW